MNDPAVMRVIKKSIKDGKLKLVPRDGQKLAEGFLRGDEWVNSSPSTCRLGASHGMTRRCTWSG